MRWAVVWPFLASLVGWAQGQGGECTAADIAVAKMSPSFGGSSGFYSIAKGISDGVQSQVNDKTLRDINDLIFGGDASVSTGDVIVDVIRSQAGAIAFWSVGFVLVLGALVFAISTCCCQCYCVLTCTGNEYGERSKVLAYVYLFLLMISFAFILTSIILFNIAALNLYSSIDQEPSYTNQTNLDLGKVLVNGTYQVSCTVNSTTDTAFSNVSLQLGNYSGVVFGSVSDQIGLTALNSDNLTAIGVQLDEAIKASVDIGNDANGVPATVDADCKQQVADLSKKNVAASILLANVKHIFDGVSGDLQNSLGQINEQIATTQNSIQQQLNAVIVQLNQAQGSIATSMDGVNSAVEQTQQEIKSLTNAVDSAQKDVVTWGGYSPVKASVRAAMTTPSAIALLFAVVGIVAIVVTLLFGSAQEHRGVSATFVLVGFYVVIFLSIFVVGFSSAGFVLGWGMSAVCEPVFQDPTFHFFDVIGQNITVSGYNNQQITVQLSQVFKDCRENRTFFYAINGDLLLSPELVDDQLNLNGYKDIIDGLINNAVFSFNVSPDDLSKLQTIAKDSNNSVANFGKPPYLQDCVGSDSDVAKLRSDSEDFYNILTDLSASVNKLNFDVNNVASNSANINQITLDVTNQQFDVAYSTINNSITSLIDQLNTDVFHCQPLYQIFENSGNIICKQFGEPIHGLWAAAGLAGLFFIPLAIVLLCTYRWLKTPLFEEVWSDERRSHRTMNDVSTVRSDALNDYRSPLYTAASPKMYEDISPAPASFLQTNSNAVYPYEASSWSGKMPRVVLETGRNSNTRREETPWATDDSSENSTRRGLTRR